MKRETIRAMLGLTQQEMAMLLNVSRGQWSMYESNRRNLPLAASLRLGEMIVYMLSPEAKALKNLPKTEREDNKIKQLLEKRLKENEFQLMVFTRKINRAQGKLEQFEKAAQLMHFLNSPAEIKKAIAPQIVPSITEDIITSFRKYKLELSLLQIDLELLQGQQQVLEKEIRFK